jgi:hypothetical protein
MHTAIVKLALGEFLVRPTVQEIHLLPFTETIP